VVTTDEVFGRWWQTPPVDRTAVPLTQREAEVLTLVQRRLTNTEIADQLFVSVRTVETHVSALLRKFAVEDRRALARVVSPEMAPAASALRSTVPSPLTPFVGRVEELSTLVAAVRAHRLVTATGPGGVGKTRLALAAAHELADDFRDGVSFVDLVKVSDPAAVAGAVADAVGATEPTGASREEAALAALRERELLLVMDNCEHLLDAARVVIERVLSTCPGVRALTTSRARLMLPFEQVFVVPGLSVDDAGGDAVTLFVQRVDAAGGPTLVEPSERQTVREICRALDGMALAIELAAARVPSVGLDGLRAGLDAHLSLLEVGRRADDRHRSLRAAIDWSYELLGADERELLLVAAMFAAPFDLNALVSLAGRPRPQVLDALARLVDWNLVSPRAGTTTRYRVLETIRQYADEQAERIGAWQDLHVRHLTWVSAELDRLLASAPGDEQWCAQVDAVADDARAALRWASARPGSGASALAERLAAVSYQRGHLGEAQLRFEEAATRRTEPLERHRLLRLAAGAATARNVGVDAVRLFALAADVAEQAGERDLAARDLAASAALQRRASGIIATPVDDTAVQALLDRAGELSTGDPLTAASLAVARAWAPSAQTWSRAQTQAAKALAEAAGDWLLIDETLDQMLVVELEVADLAGAMRAIRERMTVLPHLPDDARSGFELYDAHQMGCHVALAAGELVEARWFADRLAGLPFLREQRHLGLGRRMAVDALAGDFDAVLAAADLFERDWRLAGRPVASNLAAGACAAAMVFGILGDDAARQQWIEITEQLLPRGRAGSVAGGWKPTFDAIVALHQRDVAGAVDLLDVAPDDQASWANPNLWLWRPWYAAVWGEASALAGAPDAAERLARAATVTRGNAIATGMLDRAGALLAGDRAGLAPLADLFDAKGCPYQADRTRRMATI
jgi:predicted ATPase/DNA-binding CsgD family transcriptional regulator